MLYKLLIRGLFLTCLSIPVNAQIIVDADQTSPVNTEVVLSSCFDGFPRGTTFLWEQVAGPSVPLSGETALNPTIITPDTPGLLTFQLTLTSYPGQPTCLVNITVIADNEPPVADAGADSTTRYGATTTLDGSASFDLEDGNNITFQWLQVGGPVVSLINTDQSNPSFEAPFLDAVLEFQLIVGDTNNSLSAPDNVLVTVMQNSPPVADAGSDQTVNEFTQVTLDGSASFDPDSGDQLSYDWTQTLGTIVALQFPNGPSMPVFQAPEVVSGSEVLEFSLTVTDDYPYDQKTSLADRVTVTVQDLYAPPSCGSAYPSMDSLWPPDHKFIDILIDGLSSADDIVSIEITGVTQDEPVGGKSKSVKSGKKSAKSSNKSGKSIKSQGKSKNKSSKYADKTSPDAIITTGEPSDSVLLRAERNGKGNGRVYQVNFVASNSGGSCNGFVNVTVPHDSSHEAVDDGQLYDSTLE